MDSLLKELSEVLDNNFIDEIGITLDASLPPILRVDTKLGLAKSILKPAFTYAIERMYALRASMRVGIAIEQNSALFGDILDVTRIVLIIKGDHPIAYDLRKMMINDGYYTIQNEMAFTALLFTRHPKCPSGWQHRRWCLSRQRCARGEQVRLQAAEVETERELCRSMAEAHPKNYYAWVHRLWLIQFFTKFQIEDELHFTQIWLQSHVSDHSAANHRIQVITRIMADQEALFHVTQSQNYDDVSADNGFHSHQVQFLSMMFAESTEVIVARPGHESLWCLRRSLLEILFDNLAQHCRALNGCAFYQLFENLRVPDAYLAKLRVNINAPDENTQEMSEPAKNTSSFEGLSSAFSRDCHTFSPPPGSTLHTWLLSFLSSELQLVRQCVHDASAWDYAAQRLMALRYAAFLLDRTAHYCFAAGAEPAGPADPSVTDMAQENTAETMGSVVACQLGPEASVTLQEALHSSLRDICEQLNTEDKYSRLWLYKRAAST